MNSWSVAALVAGILFMVLALILYLRSRRITEKTMEQMSHMLESAKDGSFLEESYDESRLSQLETEMAHYLSASSASAKNLVDEKNKIKELIADISHQTKTPIANILLYAELLGEKNIPPDAADCVAQLQKQAEKLNFLIQSLVKTSRLEAGILELHSKRQPLEPVIEEVLEQIAPRAANKRISLEYEPNPELQADFDRKWTGEALYNIVDNAVKYTDPGGRIQIQTAATDLFVRVDITDNGRGIGEEEHAQIFRRFYRSPEVSEQEGIGIGLFVTRQIIAEEGGYIKLRSHKGEGSTFSVYLKK